jgi:phage FluMu protein Com
LSTSEKAGRTKQVRNSIPEALKVKVKSLRCENCGRFLAYYALVEGTIAIQCRRCHHWTALDAQKVETAPIDKPENKP